MSDRRPIGIFDSGMGGLTVMRALRDRLPHENFIYLGDTARLPYGTKSGDTVTRYAVQAARALIARDIKMLVVACNTAASVALPVLQSALAPLPVIGVIGPGAAAAVAAAKEGPIAVIATEGTVKGGAYVQAIQALAPRMPVVQQAAPLLVPLAEEGLVQGEITRLAMERYLTPLLATLRESGASASCWSGAGSTMLGLVTYDAADEVAAAARSFLVEHSVAGSVLVLDVDRSGLVTS